MKHIIYRVTYSPHLNTKYPKFYIGSKYDYKGSYYGSVSSVQIHEFTNGMPLVEWWKKIDKNDCLFEILESFQNITPADLVEVEKKYHLENNVSYSDEYFNASIATSGWVSVKRSEHTKKIMSDKTKKYWDSAAGQEKRKRLIENNKKTKSELMMKKWQDPEFRERMKYRKRAGPRKNTPFRKCKIEGVVYMNVKEASKVYNLTADYIRKKCRTEEYTEWNYYYE